MTRLPDWRQRLLLHVEAARRKPFAYGRHDCATFAAGAVAAMTGVDPAAELRGRYSTLTGGLKAVRRAGYLDAVDMVRAQFEEVSPAMAQVGDIAVVETEEGPALGIVQGPAIFVLRPEGLGVLSLLDAKRAFRV